MIRKIMPDKRKKRLMVTYISCGIVWAKRAREGVSRNLWWKWKNENERRGGGAVLHRFSNPISFVKSCLHCGHFASLYNPKLFHKVTTSNMKQCQNKKHLYINNLAGPKFYFTYAGFKIVLLFSLLYEKYWVIWTCISLVRFWEIYLNVLPKNVDTARLS